MRRLCCRFTLISGVDNSSLIMRQERIHQIRHDASTIIHGDRSISAPVFRVTNSGAAVSADYICIRCSSKGKHFAHNCFALQLTCNVCYRHKVGLIVVSSRGGGRCRRVGNSAAVVVVRVGNSATVLSRPVTSSTRIYFLTNRLRTALKLWCHLATRLLPTNHRRFFLPASCVLLLPAIHQLQRLPPLPLFLTAESTLHLTWLLIMVFFFY